MSQRIKGQEVEIILVVNGVAKTTLTAVRSFEFAYQQEIKSEGYLGETTNRKDAIFNGIRGRCEYHFDSPDILGLAVQIIDKARRRTPGVQINVKATLSFPSGRRTRVIIPNAEFGEIPFNFASRADYGTVGLDFEASEAQAIS